MTANYLTIGERVKSARTLAGWTQRELAEAIGTKQANISHIESGRANPNAGTSDRIFAVLRNASSKVAELLDTYDGVLGIQGRSAGKLGVVRDLMAPVAPKEWLVSGILAKRFVTILAGQEGAGKSMFAQTVAKALVNGESEAFGFHMPGRAMRVLMIDVENVMMVDEDTIDASLVAERLQKYGIDAERAHDCVVVGADGFDLDKDTDVLDGILKDAVANGTPFDAVILDSFRSLWTSGSENTPEAGRVLSKLNKVAHRNNVGILLLHHTNKQGAAYSGHTSIGSTVAALWTFSRLVAKNPDTGRKEQHPTMRFLNPYKVRIAPELKGRIVSTSANGIVAPMSAAEYAGLEIDPGTDDETDGE